MLTPSARPGKGRPAVVHDGHSGCEFSVVLSAEAEPCIQTPLAASSLRGVQLSRPALHSPVHNDGETW